MINLSVYLKEIELNLLCDVTKVSDIISALEMQLQELPKVDILELFRQDCTVGYSFTLKLKTYFAGLTEYFYNLSNEEVPEWVNKYKLEAPEFFYGSEILLEVMGEGSIEKFMGESVKEFRERNLIITSLLDSV